MSELGGHVPRSQHRFDTVREQRPESPGTATAPLQPPPSDAAKAQGEMTEHSALGHATTTIRWRLGGGNPVALDIGQLTPGGISRRLFVERRLGPSSCPGPSSCTIERRLAPSSFTTNLSRGGTVPTSDQGKRGAGRKVPDGCRLCRVDRS
jgi:hypothetical protein